MTTVEMLQAFAAAHDAAGNSVAARSLAAAASYVDALEGSNKNRLELLQRAVVALHTVCRQRDHLRAVYVPAFWLMAVIAVIGWLR